MRPHPIFAAGLLAWACADASAPELDAGIASDAGSACPEACRTVSLVATFGAKARAFDRMQFGYSEAASTTSGLREFYFEAYAGGTAACATQDAPTPEMTLVLAGLIAAAEPGVARTYDDGLRGSLLDFSGELVSAPVAKATTLRVTPRDPALCVACDGGNEPPRVFDLELGFEGGTIEGSAFTTHCASLDAP